MENARKIINSGLQLCKDNGLSDERATLMEHWLKLEKENGDEESLAAVRAKLPRKVKTKRNLLGADGTSHGWEEYADYVFPEDGVQAKNLKILKAAHDWKRHKQVEAS
eukprot:GHVU01011939.1.p1 GENE.GHVU01011939.1~~GHVU01011939.1.p1  ORF type:complete len:118 (+),score=24.90 GHVU01011939.1:33-356(+)